MARTRPSRTSSLSDTDLGIRCPSMPQAPAGKNLESKVASLLASLAAIMSNTFLKVAAGPAEKISKLSHLLACCSYRSCQQPGSRFSGGPRSPCHWLRGGFHPNPGGLGANMCISSICWQRNMPSQLQCWIFTILDLWPSSHVLNVNGL